MQTSSADIVHQYNAGICAMEHRMGAANARFRAVHLQGVDIFKDDSAGLRDSIRTFDHIATDGAKDFVVSIPLDASTILRQSGVKTRCNPGQFRVMSVARPFVGTVVGSGPSGAFTQWLIRIPGALLRRELPGVDDLSNTPLDIRPGAGRIMQQMIGIGFDEGDALRPQQARDFGGMLVRAVVNAIVESAPHADNEKTDAKTRLIRQAFDYVEMHLADPQLTCAALARYCGVSQRSLQMAFAEQGTTAVAFIRQRRLAMCQRDISNPDLRHVSLIETALRWGFDCPAAFSRAYKAQFGRSPSSDKRRAERGEPN